MLSRDLEVTLNSAFKRARELRHEYMTVEHLLLGLLDNASAVQVLNACGSELSKLREELEQFVTQTTPALPEESERDTQPTLGFQRVLQRAVFHVQSSGKQEVTEADLETRVALLQCAEVFVLPSLVEGLSLALLEAMASGTACVATDAGADGEALEGGAGIVLSTQGVTTQLRTLLPVLRDQPVLTAELGRRARQRALERYTISRNIDAIEALYGSLVRSDQRVA